MPGGIIPPDHKRESLTELIAIAALPPRLIIALGQYGGAPARPLVRAGDNVRKGEPIAAADGPFGNAVHAPTSGTVAAIADHALAPPEVPAAPCITLISDGRDQWIDRAGLDDYRQHSPQALLDIIHRAGIVGLGGGGFPTATKLHTGAPVATLIINAVECEPYITADVALIRERAVEIFTGIDILAHILGDPSTIAVGIEDHNPQALAALTAARADCANDIKRAIDVVVVEIPARYPSGGERQLIQILTGLEVPRGQLPADLGILCVNVATAYAVYRAICLGEPLISRIVTVTGGACAQPRNYEALIGTPLDQLLAHSGFDPSRCPLPILGGPMMGVRVADTSVPVLKTSNCILAPTAEEVPPPPPALECIRCGFCADVCPANLLPQQLYWYARTQDHDRLAAHNLVDCIECGACTYVCPSAISLVPVYQTAKAAMAAHQELQPAADRARERFRRRTQRIAYIEDEKDAHRATRLQSLQTAQARIAQQAADAPSAAVVPIADSKSDAIVEAAMALAAASKPDPMRQRARLERALLTAEDRLHQAEEELSGSTHRSDITNLQREMLRAKMMTARVQRDAAQRKLDNLFEPEQKR